MPRVFSYFVLGAIIFSSQASADYAEDVEQTCISTSSAMDVLDPLQVYGVDRLSFDIFRGRSNVGTHEVEFKRVGSRFIVDSRTEINVSVLLIPVYSYDYTSREIWCGDQLNQIKTTVTENGAVSRVTATASEVGLNVRINDLVEEVVAKEIFTTNHWNSGVLSASEVFNTITGRMNRIEIAPEKQLDDGSKVTRYRFQGELNIAVAYDGDGRWVGLYFKDKRGSDIEFRCVQCGGDPTTYANLVQ